MSDRNRAVRVAHLPARMANNPYAELLYDRMATEDIVRVEGAELTLRWLIRSRQEVDVIHFHWDEMYYEVGKGPRWLRGPRSWLRLLTYAARLGAARALRYRLCWTIHEVRPQESRSARLDRAAGRALAAACHVLTAHDRPTAKRARTELGRVARPIEIVPHGSYVGAYPSGRGRSDVRRELGVDPEAFMLLCFGHLRRHKRLETLLEAFSWLQSDRLALVIAGELAWRVRHPGDEWEERIVARLEHAADSDPRVSCMLGFVPANRVAELHAAADAAVFARDDGWTSGSLILAMSQGLPAIVARRPAYVDLTQGEAAGWLFEPGDVDSLAQAMSRAAADLDESRRRGREARRLAERMQWEDAATRLAPLLRGDRARDVVGARRGDCASASRASSRRTILRRATGACGHRRSRSFHRSFV